MNQIEKEIITKVTSVLDKFGLKYAIKDSEGTIHGELKPADAEKKGKRSPSIYGYGELRNHIVAHGVTNMAVNSHKVIPVGKFEPEILRRSVCSYGSQHWGNGTYKTKLTADRKGVEVTRFDKETAEFMQKDPLAEILDGWN